MWNSEYFDALSLIWSTMHFQIGLYKLWCKFLILKNQLLPLAILRVILSWLKSM